jgi:mono/diheme cytochrome c family protein
MRREGWIAAALIVGVAGLGALSGCGGGGGSSETTTHSETPAETPAPAADTSTTGAAGGAAGEVSLAVGERIVKERCVLCHGESGKGDGPGGAALNPKPRNWTDHGYMGSQTDEQLYQVIYNGKGAMPAWGKTGILTESEIRSAILKVRTYDPAHKG